MKRKISILLFYSLILSSCSTTSRSVLTGIGTGMTVGVANSQLLANKESSRVLLYSGLTMGLIGGITGYYTHKGLSKRDERTRKETLFNLEKYNVSSPIENMNGVKKFNNSDSQRIIIFTDDAKFLRQMRRK